jgi:CheY-like chemotaxis protein
MISSAHPQRPHKDPTATPRVQGFSFTASNARSLSWPSTLCIAHGLDKTAADSARLFMWPEASTDDGTLSCYVQPERSFPTQSMDQQPPDDAMSPVEPGEHGVEPTPQTTGEQKRARLRDLPDRRRNRPPRVLVVDDNEDLAESLALVLQSEGIDAVAAFDGKAAEDLVREEKPSVVISDLDMPVRDGYELAERLRSSDLGQDLPIVAVTGRGDQVTIWRAMEAGFQRVLVKPAVDRNTAAGARSPTEDLSVTSAASACRRRQPRSVHGPG